MGKEEKKKIIAIQCLDNSYILGELLYIDSTGIGIENGVNIQIFHTGNNQQQIGISELHFVGSNSVTIPINFIKFHGICDENGEKFYETQLETIRYKRSGIEKVSDLGVVEQIKDQTLGKK